MSVEKKPVSEGEIRLTISGASQYLGVSEVSLRQWTSEGRIKAYITPGGHRRYLRSELDRFARSHPKNVRMKDVVGTLQETTGEHRMVSLDAIGKQSRLEQVSKAEKTIMADIGRKLLDDIICFISEPSRREEHLMSIRESGTSLGGLLARIGLPLTDAVEAFLQHRDPIIQTTTELMKKKNSYPASIIGTIPLVAQAMDQGLIALVDAYQKYDDSNNTTDIANRT